MRVKLLKNDRIRFFQKISERKISQSIIASDLKISSRTFRHWRKGDLTIPHVAFKKLAEISKSNTKEFSPQLIPDFWNIKSAAKKGAYRRMELYGNLGTPEGRRKGGLNSIKKHQQDKNSNFKKLKSINRPQNKEKLAELMGILIGDGHLSEYQVGITTNSKTDMGHALFTKSLIEELFGISVNLKIKKGENTVNILAYSRNLVLLLNRNGMPIGNKIKNNVSIPSWILKNNLHQKAFIRGLFDTDGCVYIDTHKIRGKSYKHYGWTITSYADKLKDGVIEVLKHLEFNPTNKKTQKSIFLRRQKEVASYFREIGTNNPKHLGRFNAKLEEYRSGHNGAVSKTAVLARDT